MTTGERIKELRIQNGMTMEELADKLGVQKAAVYKYESGKVVNLKRDTIEKLANIFNVSPSYIMCMEDDTEDEGLSDYLEMLKNRPECRMLFQLAKDASKSDVEQAVKIIEALRK